MAFWHEVGGERLAKVTWKPRARRIDVVFAAEKATYQVPIEQLGKDYEGPKEVKSVSLDKECDSAFIILHKDGTVRAVPSDLVLWLCEDSYRKEHERRPPDGLTMSEWVGRRVRRFREKKGWSQRRLARESGMKPANMNKLEKGTHSPNLDTLVKVAKALGVAVSDLVALRKRRYE